MQLGMRTSGVQAARQWAITDTNGVSTKLSRIEPISLKATDKTLSKESYIVAGLPWTVVTRLKPCMKDQVFKSGRGPQKPMPCKISRSSGQSKCDPASAERSVSSPPLASPAVCSALWCHPLCQALLLCKCSFIQQVVRLRCCQIG